MVARHPLTRLMATYKHKFASNNLYFHEQYGKEILAKTQSRYRNDNHCVTFSKLLHYLGYYERPNEHWAPQEFLCRPCQIQYHQVLHYESIKEDLRSLLAMLDLDEIVDTVPIDTWDYVSEREIRNFMSDVAPHNVGQFVEKCSQDFEIFNYSSLTFSSTK